MSCLDEGKRRSRQYYSQPNVSAIEIRSPETVVPIQTSFIGEIILPKIYSPRRQYESLVKSRITEKQATLSILNNLLMAEKVARRQYDELLFLSAFSDYTQTLLYPRNEEHEHEKILECIIEKITGTKPPTVKIEPTQEKTNSKNEYVKILDRFIEEEQNGINKYEEFMTKIGNTLEGASEELTLSLLQMRRQVNRILHEEINHVDTLKALKDMLTST